jgi:hypothetical protein
MTTILTLSLLLVLLLVSLSYNAGIFDLMLWL